jgi:hypothetical protein
MGTARFLLNVYTDSFTSGWSNAGWSSITDLSHTATTAAGTNAIRNHYQTERETKKR